MKLKNDTYDLWKKIAMYYLPALEFLVITVFKIWGLPYGTEIGATIAAFATALGVILGISTKNYYKNIDGILPQVRTWDEPEDVDDDIEDEEDA